MENVILSGCTVAEYSIDKDVFLVYEKDTILIFGGMYYV